MIREILKILVEKAVQNAGWGLTSPSIKVQIERPENETHGDYSTNIAMIIAKQAKKGPMEVAEKIVQGTESQIDFKKIKKVEIIKPGFINFWLSRQVLIDNLNKVLSKKERYGSVKDAKKTVVIDYSSPNIAKPFGVGHLRSTIIGQALYNIYKFLGWKTIGDNHLGDWGTQFGKLIVALKKWNKRKLKDLTIQDLERLYVRFHQEAKDNSKLLDEAREWFKKLENGDKEAKKIWQFCVDISLKEYDKIYNILEIKIDYTLGESFYLYQGKVEAVIKNSQKRGIAIKSQGALVVPLDEIKTPLMLLKSDEATTYGVRDLAAIKYRIQQWKPDLIIWEVGVDQKFYFQQLFKATEILNYGKKEQLKHIAHGLIRWSDRKFSTRKGDTICLNNVLKEAIKRARQIIDKSKITKDISDKEKERIAKEIGIGAIKYNDLSRHYSKDIIFDWDNVLSLDGNSGPYLQYTAVRCQSTLDKAKKEKIVCRNCWSQTPTSLSGSNSDSLNKEEELILRALYQFPEIVQKAAENFSPNLISNFAFNLAQKYNLFYEKHSILSTQVERSQEFRLALTAGVRQILENCLTLLGISIPKKM